METSEYRWLLPSALAAAPARRSTRDWVIDGLCFVLGLGFTVLVTLDLFDAGPTTVPAWWESLPRWVIGADAALSALAAVGLWWRRILLAPLAVFLLLISLFSVASAVTLLIVVFTVAVHRRFAVLAGYVALLTLANVSFALVRLEYGDSFWEAFLWGTAVVVIVALWGMVIRARRQLIASLRERAERAEAEQRLRVVQAQVMERTRIAREMHDVLAHRISLLSLHAGALEFRPGASPEEIAGAAAVVRSSAHQALQDLREVIGVLRTGQSDEPERPQPTLGALPALAGESRAAGVRVRLDVGVDADAVPAATGRTAYRIIQEGLTNVRKHAPGAPVAVAVGGAPGAGLTIEIRNPWPVSVPTGPGSVPGTGMGLIGLAERAQLAGGRLGHGRRHDDFVLTAWLPWPSAS